MTYCMTYNTPFKINKNTLEYNAINSLNYESSGIAMCSNLNNTWTNVEIMSTSDLLNMIMMYFVFEKNI